MTADEPPFGMPAEPLDTAAAALTAGVAQGVRANDARVAQAALQMLQMDDRPGSFDRWCLDFVSAPSPR